MNKIENIRSLYNQISKKTAFIAMLAKDLGLNPQYVRSHYFSSFWTIPEKYQDRVIELLQKTIRLQNESKR